jgi:hypothetical protein
VTFPGSVIMRSRPVSMSHRRPARRAFSMSSWSQQGTSPLPLVGSPDSGTSAVNSHPDQSTAPKHH